MPSESLYGLASVLIGGALLPFLLSVLLDALALGIQRRRWGLLLGLLAATVATQCVLWWTLSLARTSPAAYEVHWSEFVGLLFCVGMVVALWHGIPRVMRSVLRRRREDQDRARPGAIAAEPAVAELPLREWAATAAQPPAPTPDLAAEALALAD
jgi:hypothetical protein